MADRPPEPASNEEITALYSAPFEEFTAKRGALAKRLRRDGDRAGAEQVRKLRKPSRSAWAVNRGVHTDPGAAERLIETGKRLEEAQRAALGGGGKRELKDAIAAQHDAIEGMMEAVGVGLGSDRVSAAILDRVRETLRAVAGDDELRAEFAAGRVTHDREAVGFGGSQVTPPPRPAKKREQPGRSAAPRREAQVKVRRAQRALDAAEKRVDEARNRLEQARERLSGAQERHLEAERQRVEREGELRTARTELEDLAGDGRS